MKTATLLSIACLSSSTLLVDAHGYGPAGSISLLEREARAIEERSWGRYRAGSRYALHRRSDGTTPDTVKLDPSIPQMSPLPPVDGATITKSIQQTIKASPIPSCTDYTTFFHFFVYSCFLSSFSLSLSFLLSCSLALLLSPSLPLIPISSCVFPSIFPSFPFICPPSLCPLFLALFIFPSLFPFLYALFVSVLSTSFSLSFPPSQHSHFRPLPRIFSILLRLSS